MDLEDNAMGLTHEQTDKILQFQDLTGIEDMSICRDVLQRHQWDLEVIISFKYCVCITKDPYGLLLFCIFLEEIYVC